MFHRLLRVSEIEPLFLVIVVVVGAISRVLRASQLNVTSSDNVDVKKDGSNGLFYIFVHYLLLPWGFVKSNSFNLIF